MIENQSDKVELDDVKALLNKPLAFDDRCLPEPTAMREMGFERVPIARQ